LQYKEGKMMMMMIEMMMELMIEMVIVMMMVIMLMDYDDDDDGDHDSDDNDDDKDDEEEHDDDGDDDDDGMMMTMDVFIHLLVKWIMMIMMIWLDNGPWNRHLCDIMQMMIMIMIMMKGLTSPADYVMWCQVFEGLIAGSLPVYRVRAL